jgi:hypothetical protein
MCKLFVSYKKTATATATTSSNTTTIGPTTHMSDQAEVTGVAQVSVEEDTEAEEALVVDIVEAVDTSYLVKSVVISATSLDAGQLSI